MNDFQQHTQKNMAALEAFLAPIFKNAPHLPASARDSLVSLAPWLALIFGILGLLALASLSGLSSLFFWIPGMAFMQVSFMLSVAAGIVASILQLLAYKPLTEKKKKGWNLLFYGAVLSAVSTVLHVVVGYGSIASMLFIVIGFWLLFEIRDAYKA